MNNIIMKQKILIISGSMVHRTPHVKMYMNIFDRLGVEYDVVVWNRKGDSTDGIYSNYILYSKFSVTVILPLSEFLPQ